MAETFFSIVFGNINPVIGERIALGLYFLDGEKVFFDYSLKKLRLFSNFVSTEVYDLVSDSLIGLKQSEYAGNFISELTTMSIYFNNSITFSKPACIDLECTKDNFDKLYKKYIDDIR